MLPTYLESRFSDQPLTCAVCHWKGEGHRANIIDFYGIGDHKEIHCPECDEKLGLLKKDQGQPPGESANDLSFQIG